MRLTLLVENNPKIEGFYILNLTTWLGLNIVRKKSSSEAIETLDKQKFELIIVRSHIDKDDSARKIIEQLKVKGLQIPVIVIGPGPEVSGSFAHIANSMQIKQCIQAAAKALRITAKEMMNKVVPDFFPIPIHFFSQLKRSVCNAYTLDQFDPNNYILRLEKNKDFTPTTISDLVQEGNSNLFIDKMDRLDFVNNLTAEYMTVLQTADLSDEENLSVAEAGHELLSKKLVAVGVTEETVALAEKSMDTMKKNALKAPNMAKLLERMAKNQQGYLFKHTQILTYVCLHMVKNIEWGSAEQEEKISFIAFFHDIALENDAQAKIRNTVELKSAGLPLADQMIVEKHAQIAAEIVAKYPHAPMGADQIIRQHHGQLNGAGFSETFGANLSPLAIVLIVAEEFTHIMLRNEMGPFDQKAIIRELKAQFPKAKFKKMVDVLESITLS